MPRERKLPEGMSRRGQVYYANFRKSGRLVRKRLSGDFRVACQLLTELRNRADKGDFGLVDNEYSWDTLKREFLRWAKQSVRDYDEYERDLKKFEAFTKLVSVKQLSQQLVVKYREWRLETGKVSPRTVNRQVGTLHNMLAKGVKWGVIGTNPLVGLKPLRHDTLKKERRPLTTAEVLALFKHSPEHLKPVWRMFLCTGIRHAELVNMRFADVDFERGVVTVRAEHSKNHKPREIPLDDHLLATIKTLRDEAKHRQPVETGPAHVRARKLANFSRDHVFVTRSNTPWRNHLLTRFYAACDAAGIEGAESGGAVDIHSLRVSFTTLSIENGASPKAVQAILGHSTLAMTMSVYAKATERSKRDAISSLPFAVVSTPEHVVAVDLKASQARARRAQKSEGTEEHNVKLAAAAG